MSVVAALVLPGVALLATSVGTAASVLLVFGIVASVAATLAGFAALVRHRVAGDAPMAYLGFGLLVYGGSVSPLTAVVGQLNAPAKAEALESLRLAAVVAVVVLFAGGLMVAEVDTAVTAPRIAWVSFGGVVALAATLQTAWRVWGAATNDVTTRAMVPLWLAVACGYLAAGIRRRRAAFWRVGGGLLVITVAHFLRATHPSPGESLALSLSAIRMVGAVAIVLGVVPDLAASLSARRRADAVMRERWTSAEAERHKVLCEAAERRHELANALAGIAGANHALDSAGRAIDADDAALLRRAVQQEVERLQHLIAHQGLLTPDRPFLVCDVIRPLVAARCALGERVTLTGDPAIQAFGSPDALSQILVNLLTNCARYARGGKVEITATRMGTRVVVRVVDEGPVSEVDAFAGSGIGLAVSSRIARQHGGCLRLLAPSTVGRGFGVAVELPAPPPSSPSDDPHPKSRCPAARRSPPASVSGSR